MPESVVISAPIRAEPIKVRLTTIVRSTIRKPLRTYTKRGSRTIPKCFLVFSCRSYENNVMRTAINITLIIHPTHPATKEKALIVIGVGILAQGKTRPIATQTAPRKTSLRLSEECQKKFHTRSKIRTIII